MATTVDYPTEILNRNLSNQIYSCTDISALCIIYYCVGNLFCLRTMGTKHLWMLHNEHLLYKEANKTGCA
jgi:hypothetical protein